MTWTWLFVWNVSWLIFALLYMTLETRFAGDSPQGGRYKLERREEEAPRANAVPYERDGFTAVERHEGTLSGAGGG